MKTIYTIVLLILFSAFAKAQDTTYVEVPKIVIKAFQGELVPIGDIGIKLIQVLEDSRCPQGVDCVWEGQAKALVQITDRNGKKTQKEIVMRGGTVAPLYTEDGLEIIVRGLSPYPKASSKIEGKEYYLLLDVIK